MSIPAIFRTLDSKKFVNARIVKDTGQVFDLETVITKLSDAVKEEPVKIVSSDMGKMVLAAWTLLEILNKGYFEELAESICSSSVLLQEAAFYTAIGIEIGLVMPKDIKIETVKVDSDEKENLADIRESTTEQSN